MKIILLPESSRPESGKQSHLTESSLWQLVGEDGRADQIAL